MMDVQNGTLYIQNRKFILYREVTEEKSQYIIQSDDWRSLIGNGRSIDEALESIAKMMQEVKPYYCTLGDDMLTQDAQEMVAWLKHHVI